MTAHERVFKGAKIGGNRDVAELTTAMKAIIPKSLRNEDVVFVCIGTDRCTGDSLGPLVGMYLTGIGYENVYGTLDNPVHAMNLSEIVSELPEGKRVIAIDASLGSVGEVGSMSVIDGPTKPGAGVGKDHLPYVGTYSITGVVNVSGFMDYQVLAHTRLSVVVRLAKDIASAIVNVFPLNYESSTERTESSAGTDIQSDQPSEVYA